MVGGVEGVGTIYHMSPYYPCRPKTNLGGYRSKPRILDILGNFGQVIMKKEGAPEAALSHLQIA